MKTDTYIEDGLLIIFADDAWEVWCGADGENIINAHLIGSNPSREAAGAGAREELLELADRLSKHLPLADSPLGDERRRATETDKAEPTEEFIRAFLAAYYGFPSPAVMETFHGWSYDIRDDVKLIQAWASLKGADDEEGPATANHQRIQARLQNEEVSSLRTANDGTDAVLPPLSQGTLLSQREVKQSASDTERLRASLREQVATWRREANEIDEATQGQWLEPEIQRQCADELEALLVRQDAETKQS